MRDHRPARDSRHRSERQVFHAVSHHAARRGDAHVRAAASDQPASRTTPSDRHRRVLPDDAIPAPVRHVLRASQTLLADAGSGATAQQDRGQPLAQSSLKALERRLCMSSSRAHMWQHTATFGPRVRPVRSYGSGRVYRARRRPTRSRKSARRSRLWAFWARERASRHALPARDQNARQRFRGHPALPNVHAKPGQNDQFSLRGFANPIPASPMPSSANVAGSGSSDSGRLAAKKFPSSFATDSCASVALVTVK